MFTVMSLQAPIVQSVVPAKAGEASVEATAAGLERDNAGGAADAGGVMTGETISARARAATPPVRRNLNICSFDGWAASRHCP
jgi:hypothetical protein